jgi:hypothetical protein
MRYIGHVKYLLSFKFKAPNSVLPSRPQQATTSVHALAVPTGIAYRARPRKLTEAK